MAKFEPTKSQELAINSRAKTVVVSAGAGSGKTAVLTERIVSRLCNDRADIDRFLVVTYTNAAAFEMRERIAARLSERISENLHDPSLCEHLRRQVGKLPCAKVQTVHSFCLELIRRNANVLGLSPHFGIGDDAVLGELRKSAIDRTLDSAYSAPPEGFAQLRACLCEERGDKKLAEAVQFTFERLQSLPYPEKWLHDQIAAPETDTDSCREALDEAVFMVSNAHNALLCAQDQLRGSFPDVAAVIEPHYALVCKLADELTQALRRGDTDGAIQMIADYKTTSIRPPKDTPKEPLDFAKKVRENFKKTIEAIPKLLRLPDADHDTRIAEKCLCRLALTYGEYLREEKNRAEIVDFNDLEHYAVRLLSDEQGESSPLSVQLRGYLCELMVDEYQDSNRVQDTIFDLVSPYEGSAFFVGDIKQSIYRFRKADPRIFAEKCKRAQEDPDSVYIAMDTNFRSRGEVLGLCNYFFEQAMTESFGDVNYSEPGQPLQVGRKTAGNLPSELCMLDTPSLKSVIYSDDGLSAAQTEAEFVASRIKDMLLSGSCFVPDGDGRQRPAKASDFAIILSSYSNKAPLFEKALANLGLDSAAETEDSDPFTTVEGSIIISLLRVVSNRRQDIPLLSLLRSPLFAFTADDIAKMRACNTYGDMWDALMTAAYTDDKCRAAADKIEQLCNLAKDMSCAEFLQYVYAHFGVYGVFSALGKPQQRADTLDALYQEALRCEKGSFAHVSRLVDSIDRRTAKKSASSAPGEGVRIISIHKSKGLEFPFVFLCDLCKLFNTDDLKADVLLHTEKGLALRRTDTAHRVRTATKKRSVISRAIVRELRAEELRKLYVAMTRAREKLFLVVSTGRSTIESMVTGIFEKAGEYPTEYFMKEQTNSASWLVAVLLSHPGAITLRSCLPAFRFIPDTSERTLICSAIRYIKDPDGVIECEEESQEPAPAPFDPMDYLPLSEKVYAYSSVSALPSKITPSGAHALKSGTEKRVYFAPDDDGTDKLTAAEKGTRVHAMLARLPLDPELSAEEIVQLPGYEDCQQVDAKMAEGFLHSALGRQAAGADRCLREYQFSVLLTPQELGLGEMEDEYILLNGSIDMMLIDDDKITIADFKSDSVKAGSETLAAEKHRDQLELYAMAASKIFELPVVKKSVFFLKTATEVKL
ncbi:MAG: UvrD-helicase domain-containing protein [Clostridia bacterium]|nr:UvrD-helicase domain-containing protein [Clostridia bacterium]